MEVLPPWMERMQMIYGILLRSGMPEALSELRTRQSYSPDTISGRIGLSPETTQTILDDLFRHGFVRREENDAEYPPVRYSLTPKGVKLDYVLSLLHDLGADV